MKKFLALGLMLAVVFGAFAQGQPPEAGAFGFTAQAVWPFNVWAMENDLVSSDFYLPYELGARWHVFPFLMVEPKATFAIFMGGGNDFAYGASLGIDYWKNLKDGISVYIGPAISYKRYKYDGSEGNMSSLKIDFGVQYTIAGRLGLFADYGIGIEGSSSVSVNDGKALLSLGGGKIGLVFYL